MPDTKTTNEATRSPIDGTELVRLATPGANWKATLTDILTSMGSRRINITTSTDFHVATTGNDSTGDGTVGNPWLTLQHAANFVSQNYFVQTELATSVTVNIRMADGTYATTYPATSLPSLVGFNSPIFIHGNDADHTKVILTNSGDNCTISCYGNGWSLQHVTIVNTNSPNTLFALVWCEGSFGSTAYMWMYDVALGNAGDPSGGPATQGYHLAAQNGASLEVQWITVTGTAYSLFFAKGSDSNPALVGLNHGDVTLLVDPLWPYGTFKIERWGQGHWNMDGVLTGTSSGPKINISALGKLLVASGLTTMPGVASTNTIEGEVSSYNYSLLGISNAYTAHDDNSGTILVQAPTTGVTSWTLKLPPTAGTNNYVLETDGTGITNWVAQSGGGLTVGTTSISGGTTLRVLYDNAGVLGEYTNTQLTALINPFTSTLSGAAPLSGGGTTNFLRADGTWTAPTAVAAPAGSDTQVQYNFAGVTGAQSNFVWDYTNKKLKLTNTNIIQFDAANNLVTSNGTQMELQQTGDTFGATSIQMQNRIGLNGCLFTNSGLDLVDFGLVTSTTAQGNYRFEHRIGNLFNSLNTNGELQKLIGGTLVATFGQSPSAGSGCNIGCDHGSVYLHPSSTEQVWFVNTGLDLVDTLYKPSSGVNARFRFEHRGGSVVLSGNSTNGEFEIAMSGSSWRAILGDAAHAFYNASNAIVLDWNNANANQWTFAQTNLHNSSVALTNGAAAQLATLTNAPAAGNPTKWVPINDNGTTRYIPAW